MTDRDLLPGHYDQAPEREQARRARVIAELTATDEAFRRLVQLRNLWDEEPAARVTAAPIAAVVRALSGDEATLLRALRRAVAWLRRARRDEATSRVRTMLSAVSSAAAGSVVRLRAALGVGLVSHCAAPPPAETDPDPLLYAEAA